MNSLLEEIEVTEVDENYESGLDTRQSGALELIRSAVIPEELKDHFSDMIRLFGKETTGEGKAKQILNIADELQLAKRAYIDDHKLDNDSSADLLISEIVKIYWQ